MFCTPSLAVCSTRCSQPDLNLAEAKVAANELWYFVFQELHGSASILMTSNYIIITLCCASSDGAFHNFSVALNVKVNCARNYKNLLNFVIVEPKILVVLFFPHMM